MLFYTQHANLQSIYISLFYRILQICEKYAK